LILASIHGELRLWGSIGIGLAGGEHYTTIELPLQGDEGELLTTLTRVDVRYSLD
jgi:nuclear pore complex protein Nup133